MTRQRFHIEQIAPDLPDTWAVTECFYWHPAANQVLRRGVDEALLSAAYDAVDWESDDQRLKGMPFCNWAVEGGGILSFGGPAHVEKGQFFSHIGDLSTVEGNWWRVIPRAGPTTCRPRAQDPL